MSLLEANWKNTVEFTPIVKSGKVIKVYDCDTITIACKIPYLTEIPESDTIYRFHIRLIGIDSAEIKSKDKDEKYVAILARDKLSELILNKNVILKNQSSDKYGRILANVYLIQDSSLDNESLDICKWTLSNRYAVPYDGGKKNSPNNWRIYLETGLIK